MAASRIKALSHTIALAANGGRNVMKLEAVPTLFQVARAREKLLKAKHIDQYQNPLDRMTKEMIEETQWLTEMLA